MSTAESSVKRRGSPSSVASEEPNPKRTDACAEDSPLVTQLINDKFIKGLACVLAEDELFVGMAENLLEGALSEHGTLDFDAWKYFTSLPIRRNDEFVQCQTKMGPKQKYLKQIIKQNPLLKPLMAEKEHIRVVLILVSLFSSPDVSPRDGTDSEGFVWKEEGCCMYNKSFDLDQLEMCLPYEIGKVIWDLADKLMKDQKIVETFRELVGTAAAVRSVSPQGALEHFEKVKEVWRNQRFFDHILKFQKDLSPRDGGRDSNVRLSAKIKSLIKVDPLFETILKYDDPDFRRRVALSILIGFWSNQDMILSLGFTMGGGEEKEQSGEGKEDSPRNWMSSPPNILEFYHDKSIWKLADQLKEEPKAVSLADFYLITLELDDCYCSYESHYRAAFSFWRHPSIILKFSEAMKKDSNLVEVLTKYSKGAQTLRVQERLFHIRKENQLYLRAIDSLDDTNWMMRLALQILFGYWVDGDVTHLFRSLCKAKRKIGEKFHLSEDDEMAAFYYYASCATDVEGLKSCLSNKYGKGSDKALSLTEKIGKYQKEKCEEAIKSGYNGELICVHLVLKEACIVTFSLWLYDFSEHRKWRKKELLDVLLPL